VDLNRTQQSAGSSGTAFDKYIDVLNMIRNQLTAIFPSGLDDRVCTNELPAETLSV
jgi:hypothetical protein